MRQHCEAVLNNACVGPKGCLGEAIIKPSVSRNDEGGNPRSGQAIRAQAQGFQGGYALVTPLAVEALESK
ncbi:hypothetical protein CS537_15875 [Yersinia mollaretii]|nr:hypothetical protein CS537_15875 [Yersinia mollaretii]